MTFEWKVVTIEDVTEIVTKGTTPTTLGYRFNNEGINFVKVEAITENGRFDKQKFMFINEDANNALKRSILKNGDVLFTIAGTIGRTALVDKSILPANINQAVAIVRPKTDLIRSKYLKYVLSNRSFTNSALSRVVQSVQSNFSLGELKNTKVFLPPIATQDKVVNVLDSFDRKINLLADINKNLESIAQAIFKSWFIDFDPVHAKLQGKECVGIDKATADLFPSSFVESELGLIPKDWEVKSLGDKVVPKRGKTITKSTTTTGKVPVVAGGLDPAYFHNQSNVLSPAITISSSGANAGFVRLYQQDIWASDCCYISSEQNQEVFYWYIFLKANQEKIYFMQQGAAQPHIYASDLMRLTICSPKDSKLVTAFNILVTPLFNRIKISNNQIETLSNLRDALLPRLISGKLDLSNIEEQLEGVS